MVYERGRGHDTDARAHTWAVATIGTTPTRSVWHAAVVATAIAGPALADASEYLRGRDLWLFPCLFYPFPLLALQWLHYPVALALAFAAIEASRRKELRRRLTLAALAVITGIGPNMFGGWCWPADRPPFLRGYAAMILRNTDPADLRGWASGLLERHPVERTGALVSESLPRGIRAHPFLSIVPAGDQGGRHVKLSDGGHFVEFWGLRVGSSSYRCPQSSNLRTIAPGVCVFGQEERVFGLTN